MLSFAKTAGILGLVWLMAGCGPSEPIQREAAPVPSETSPPIRWLKSYEEALDEGRMQNKRVLLVFTGLDWSDACREFQDKVLLTPGFANFAAENLILVKIDFPMHTRQPPEMATHHETLSHNFDIEEFPTLVLLNPDGTESARLEEPVPDDFSILRAWLEGSGEP